MQMLQTAFVALPSAPLTPRPAPPSLRASAQARPTGEAAWRASVAPALGAGAAVGAMLGARRARVRRAAFDPTNAPGAQAPFGYWDPVGLMKERVGEDGWQWKSLDTFKQYRAAELKHGRLAMVALTGMFAANAWRFPGEEFDLAPNGVQALSSDVAAGFGVVLLMAGWVELKVPFGNFEDPLGWGKFNSWGYTQDMQSKELAHGRLAMSTVVTVLLFDAGEVRAPSAMLGGQTTALLGTVLLAIFLYANYTKPEIADGITMGLQGGFEEEKKGE